MLVLAVCGGISFPPSLLLEDRGARWGGSPRVLEEVVIGVQEV